MFSRHELLDELLLARSRRDGAAEHRASGRQQTADILSAEPASFTARRRRFAPAASVRAAAQRAAALVTSE